MNGASRSNECGYFRFFRIFSCLLLANHDFFALMDIDAGGSRHLGAKGTAHQVIVAWIKRAARLVGIHLINAVKGAIAGVNPSGPMLIIVLSFSYSFGFYLPLAANIAIISAASNRIL